jgi:hypothetical protein
MKATHKQKLANLFKRIGDLLEEEADELMRRSRCKCQQRSMGQVILVFKYFFAK